MQKQVVMPQKEWDSIPVELAKRLAAEARKSSGFRIVDKESGEEIVDRLEDWLCGNIYLAFHNAFHEDSEQ